MAYKTGAYKTKYFCYDGYGYDKVYTLYCAVESVTDTCRYVMIDEDGKEQDITIIVEDDTDSRGCRSIIDCLYWLKQGQSFNEYDNHDLDIIVTYTNDPEEIDKIFGK